MHIRPAQESDRPSIIELLKISLGESLIPKSEKLWKWKHEDNPFGNSPVLLAEENGILIGVRAFLKWEFLSNGKTIQACRAVDTATHPDFQGKGIFNQLTIAMLAQIKKDGVDFIFNTPNSKSTPGYLKMGWESWGKLPLKLNFHLGNSGKSKIENSDWHQLNELINKIETAEQRESGTQTKRVPGYLHWRYRDNPLYAYQTLTDGINFLLIYRIKDGKMGREFRICDLFTTRELDTSQQKELKKLLNQQVKSSGARFSSFSGLDYSNQHALDLGLLPILKIGPLVTLRQVNEKFPLSDQNWLWSLGDLEVF